MTKMLGLDLFSRKLAYTQHTYPYIISYIFSYCNVTSS